MNRSPTQPNGINLRLALGLALVGAAGVLLLLWTTPRGVGLYYDSMPYLESAENALAGQGFGRVTCEAFKPMTRYPPFYSVLLAGLIAMGIEPYAGARLLSAAALGVASVLLGATLWRTTRSWTVSVLGGVILLISTPVLGVFTWAMSEPAYLALWLSSLLLADMYLVSGQRHLLVASGIAAALAFLTRYVGALPIAAIALFLTAGAIRRRNAWSDVGWFLAIACMPVALWIGRGLLVAGNPTSRELEARLPDRAALREGVETVVGWYGRNQGTWSEEQLLAAFAALVLAFVVLWMSLARRRSPAPPATYLVPLHIASTAAYCIGVMVSILLFDPMTPLDDRILIPVYLSMVIVLLTLLHRAIAHRSIPVAVLGLVIVVALVSNQLGRFGGTAARLRADGQGYAGARWRNSQVAEWIRQQRPAVIYTNDITAVYFGGGGPSCAIPALGADAAMASMRERLQKDGGIVAIFGSVTGEFAPMSELTEGLTLIEEVDDGQIYEAVTDW